MDDKMSEIAKSLEALKAQLGDPAFTSNLYQKKDGVVNILEEVVSKLTSHLGVKTKEAGSTLEEKLDEAGERFKKLLGDNLPPASKFTASNQSLPHMLDDLKEFPVTANCLFNYMVLASDLDNQLKRQGITYSSDTAKWVALVSPAIRGIMDVFFAESNDYVRKGLNNKDYVTYQRQQMVAMNLVVMYIGSALCWNATQLGKVLAVCVDSGEKWITRALALCERAMNYVDDDFDIDGYMKNVKVILASNSDALKNIPPDMSETLEQLLKDLIDPEKGVSPLSRNIPVKDSSDTIN